MEKRATTQFPLEALLARRWSPRAFAETPVSQADLGSLFEAARWAPSSMNEQPWRFIVATREDPLEHQRLLGCLAPSNQVWAKNASVLILAFARTAFVRNDKPNRHAFHDLGMAIENLLLQAVSLGLQTHPMAGINHDEIRSAYVVPEAFEAVTAIAVGYPAPVEQLPQELQLKESAERQRRPSRETFYRGAWGQTFDWLD